MKMGLAWLWVSKEGKERERKKKKGKREKFKVIFYQEQFCCSVSKTPSIQEKQVQKLIFLCFAQHTDLDFKIQTHKKPKKN